MKSRYRWWVPLLLLLFLLVLAQPGTGTSDDSAQNGAGMSLSPINPLFTRYLNDFRSRLDLPSAPGNALGLVPATVDLSHLTGTQISDFSTLASTDTSNTAPVFSIRDSTSSTEITSYALPGSYDLRTQGRVNGVQDQGECGSCWAFSTFASLESGLKPESWDFSENNMRNSHGYDLSSCQGGNAQMATAYLARWSGPLKESSDPYTGISKSASSVTAPNSASVKHIQEVLFIPARSGSLDNQNLKKALTERGAVYSTIRWEESSYRPTTASYYYSGKSQENHAITIVGWDDTYDRSHFASTPPGDGAFIVKNSWGSDWGMNGYFYVSYYDTVIGRDNAFFSAEDKGNYDQIYQYDPLGWVVSYGDNSDTAYFANVFTSLSAEDLAAVSFYTPSANSKYQVSVYTGVQSSPVSGLLEYSQSGTIVIPGYHTIDLSIPVPLQKGERFSVVVKLTTPGYQYPVAIEYPYGGFSSGASASSGQSFVSTTGTLWTDLTSVYKNSNVCLKAFTTKGPDSSVQVPTSTPTPQPSSGGIDTRSPSVSITSPRAYSTIAPGSSVQVAWTAIDNVAVAGVDIGYSKDKGKTWVTVARNLVTSGTYSLGVPSDISGTFIIRVTARDPAGNEGSSTKSCMVKSSSQMKGSILTTALGPVDTVTKSVSSSPVLAMDTSIPTIAISSPPPYRSIMPGTTLQVIWHAADTAGIAGVDIWISKDYGRSWETVAKNLAPSGTYPLNVPADVSGTFLIRAVAWDNAGNAGSSIRNCIVSTSSPHAADQGMEGSAALIPPLSPLSDFQPYPRLAEMQYR